MGCSNGLQQWVATELRRREPHDLASAMVIVERLGDFKQRERPRSPRHERAKDGGDDRSKSGSPKATDDERNGDEGRHRHHKGEKKHGESRKQGDSRDHKAYGGLRRECFYCACPHYGKDCPHKGKMIAFLEKHKSSNGDSSRSDGEARIGALQMVNAFMTTAEQLHHSHYHGYPILPSSVSYVDDYNRATTLFTSSNQEALIKVTTKSIPLTYQGKILDVFSVIDLSCDKLTGLMTLVIGNIVDTKSPKLSYNCLRGIIPTTFSNLKGIGSMDLSFNKLSGGIPSQLANTDGLGSFNVSFNNLSGMIPQANYIQTSDELSKRKSASFRLYSLQGPGSSSFLTYIDGSSSPQKRDKSFIICVKCFKDKNYGDKCVDDFKFIDSNKDNGGRRLVWTEAETLLLLESVLRHGDDWELVTQNMKTKGKVECISKLLELPFGELMFGAAHDKSRFWDANGTANSVNKSN
ncbi:hypothetical protein RJ640_002996 [Escallonia rubra]|uniref:SANT domain-containing protein n=1 Tax=Escallonia rubra TaxID=112253 RepID=A0AA88R5K0_9ASTE|nr:hypothetical protein RJ640_002996 [Escallonia rubra]